MQLDLPPHVIEPLKARVAAGEFSTIDAAVQHALEAYLAHKQQAESLRADLQQGIDSLNRGDRRQVDESFWSELRQHVRASAY